MPGAAKPDTQRGFNLIELLLTMMVIAIMAGLFMPTLRQNAVRAKLSEALVAFGTCRNMVTEIYMSGGDGPGANNWGCEATNASSYVDTITTSDEGIIKVSLRGFRDLRLDYHDLTLAPLDSTGTLANGSAGAVVRRWRCGNSDDGTSIDSKYLPRACQGG